MKIKIESDVFDIVKRIKEIDDGYYILFDLNKQKFEVHNCKQSSSYCFTYPYDNLDERVFEMIYATNSKFIDKIIEDIDKNNTKIEKNNENKRKDFNDYYLREIYNFSNNSSKNYNEEKAFSNVWR